MNELNMEKLMPLLSKQINRYTNFESTSVSYDTAKKLMSSIIYCLNGVKSYNGLNEISTIDNDIEKVFQIGLEVKKEKIKAAIEIYNAIMDDFHGCNNRCYEDTIIKGIPEFFKWYDVEFDGTNHILTLDYPLYNEIEKLSGVDLIYEYLKCIEIENRFLKSISEKDIFQTLRAYHKEYSELILNISKLIVQNCIGCALLMRSDYSPLFNRDDIKKIEDIINNSSNDALNKLIKEALNKGLSYFLINDKELLTYFTMDLEKFKNELNVYVKEGILGTIFKER